MLNIKIAGLFVIVVGVGFPVVSVAESLKKQREWPPTMPQISPQVKEQYEYDPEAGAGSKKLISVAVVTSVREFRSEIVTIFRNGGASEWRSRDLVTGRDIPATKVLWAYHGYGSFFDSTGNPIDRIVFEPSGKWPASQFKVLTAFRDGMKFMFSCELRGKVPAATVYSQLPGNLYNYDCLSRSNSAHSSTKVWVKSVYSDYLDIQVSSEIDKKRMSDMSGFQGSSVETSVKFYDLNGVAQSIVSIESR